VRNIGDVSAFLAGHASHQPSADVNADGEWDQADIDSWNTFFDIDTH
jgi:hypothetical protein